MKKYLCLFLCLTMTLFLTACKKEETKLQSPVKYYYCREDVTYWSDSNIFGYEEREAHGYEDNVYFLVSRYLRGPESGEFTQTFPDYTRLISYKVGENEVSLKLSDEIASISGMELTLACVALTMTVREITGLDTISVQAETVMLDGKQVITYSYSDFAFLDNAWEIPPTTTFEEPTK